MKFPSLSYLLLTFIWSVAHESQSSVLTEKIDNRRNFNSINKLSSKFYTLVSQNTTGNILTCPIAFTYYFLQPHEYINGLNSTSFLIDRKEQSNSVLQTIPNEIQSITNIYFNQTYTYSSNIYISSKWRESFSEYSTTVKPFYAVNKNYSVNMMNIESYFWHGRISHLRATFLELPYKMDNIYMLIVLPDEVDGLEELEENIASMPMHTITKYGKREVIDVELPKFRLRHRIELRTKQFELLRDNIPIPHDISGSQLAMISTQEDPSEHDYENDGIGFFPVTLANGMHFNVNHPFHFKIFKRFEESDLILFIGSVKDFENM